MEALVRHLIEPLVAHPEAIQINDAGGEASIILELTVHEDDREVFEENEGRALRHVRTLLSAAAGRKKATIELAGDGEHDDETDAGDDDTDSDDDGDDDELAEDDDE